MNFKNGRLILLFSIISTIAWYYYPREPTILSFRITQTFEEVVRNSTYPVVENSVVPTQTYLQSGETFVTEPAVSIRMDDPLHGFILPPTKFAMVSYDRNHVSSLTTSPMLRKLSFTKALAILEDLQDQFAAGGWEPWKENGSAWFDLSPEGKNKLHARMFEPGYAQTVYLRVPKKYEMIFRLKCAEGCWTLEPPYRFLIDVSIGDDVAGWEPGDPMVWDKSHPAAQSTTISTSRRNGNDRP